MRWAVCALAGAMLLSGCGEHAANPYPEHSRVAFLSSCAAGAEVCGCTWDKLTRELTHDQYEAAMARFRETGRMDHHVTHAHTVCVERRH